MNTFILFWNPAISSWKLDEHERNIDNGDIYSFNWSVWEHKKAQSGDRCFLVRCGDGNTGVFLSGQFCSEPWQGEDWSGKGREVYYANIDVEVILNTEQCPILTTAELQAAIPDFDWTGGHSGRVVTPEQAEALEKLWADFLAQHDDLFHRKAIKRNIKDDDDDDDYDDGYYADFTLTSEGKVYMEFEQWGDIIFDVECDSFGEAKEALRKKLIEHNIDEEKIEVIYTGVSKEYQPLYEKAFDIACTKHQGQKDKGGKPYIGHVVRVVKGCSCNEKIMIVALLHDTMEDADVTPEYLKAEGFPDYIVNAVIALTRKDGEDYMEYIARLAKNGLAREVKKADLEDNMNIRRLATLNEADFKRLQRYLQAWNYLQACD